MTEPLRSWLTEARATVSGEYASISRVVDALLDLRSLAADEPDLVETVDELMATIPGRTVTPNEWWIAQLDALELRLTRPVTTI